MEVITCMTLQLAVFYFVYLSSGESQFTLLQSLLVSQSQTLTRREKLALRDYDTPIM